MSFIAWLLIGIAVCLQVMGVGIAIKAAVSYKKLHGRETNLPWVPAPWRPTAKTEIAALQALIQRGAIISPKATPFSIRMAGGMPPLESPVESRLGYAVGVRMWWLAAQGLTSTPSWAAWQPYEPVVATHRGAPEHPFWQCPLDPACGIYALKPVDLKSLVLDADAIVGAVALWGHVIEHEDGYRGEYAYPLAILNNTFLSEAIAKMYGVPCLTEEELCQLLANHRST